MLIPFEDQLYFENIPDNTGAVGLVYYEYAALDGACTAGLTPYQEVASGYDNEKFNGDFGYGIPPLESVEPELTFTKAVAPGTASPGDTLTYTLGYTNPATYTGGIPAITVGDPALGLPLVVQETVPAGTCYIAGSADDNAPPSAIMISSTPPMAERPGLLLNQETPPRQTAATTRPTSNGGALPRCLPIPAGSVTYAGAAPSYLFRIHR